MSAAKSERDIMVNGQAQLLQYQVTAHEEFRLLALLKGQTASECNMVNDVSKETDRSDRRGPELRA